MDSFSNGSINSTSTGKEAELPSISIFNVVWQSLYSFLTVFVNVVILYVFIFKLKERTYSNMCFISLAFCDLVVGLIILPATIYQENVGYDFNYYLGIAISICEYAQPSVGFLILLQLTVHRIFQVTKPTKTTEKLTTLRILLLVGVWIFEYLAWFLIYLACILTDNYQTATIYIEPPAIYILLIDIVLYMIPLLTNIAFIIALIIILVVRSQKKKKKLNYTNPARSMDSRPSQIKIKPNSQSRRFKISRDVKAVTFLLILIIMILVTQSFYIITWPLTFYGYEIDSTLFDISDWLSYANSFFHPVVLFFFHEPLKNKLIEMTWAKLPNIFTRKSEC